MKFSVLLPTRNGLTFLKSAVASVLKQSYDNWELIISDNASTDNIKDYVTSLNDHRIVYIRSEEFLSVTENWNRCLNESSGDYIIMLGDDDILLKNYFEISKKLILNFQQPELIYSNAFLYAYPGVLPNFPKGLFHNFGSLNAMPKHDTPFWLDKSSRIEIVRQILKFVPIYGTNMQHALIHKDLIQKIKRNGKFFYSPYPDFYSMCAMFLEADKVLIYPKELVVIGITPKSHGYYFFNGKESEGVAFLNIKKEFDSIPGLRFRLLPPYENMRSFWLGAMEILKNHFPLEKYNLKMEYRLYREEQMKSVIQNYLSDKEKFKPLFKSLLTHITFSEKLFVANLLLKQHISFVLSSLKAKLPKSSKTFLKKARKLLYGKQTPSEQKAPVCDLSTASTENRFRTALEVFDAVEPVDVSNL